MPRGKRNNYNYYYPQRSLAVGKRNKYSTMTYIMSNGDPTEVDYKPYFTVVPPTDIGGMRKVKNITIQLSYDGTLSHPSAPDNRILWALIYVPKGSEPGDFNQNSGILYSPPQFIMASGIYDTNNPGNSSRIFTPLSRNLNAGDGIALLYKPLKSIVTNQITIVINYAITLQ